MTIDEAALQRLLDKEAIREASLKYTRGIDRHDDEILRQAFHPDARDDHGDYIGGPEGLIQYTKSMHSDNWKVHHHFVSNMTIELDGDVAHCETYFFVTLARHEGGTDIGIGRYLDRFEKRAGKWAVADRICLVEWNALIPEQEGIFDSDSFVSGTWDKSDPSYMRPLKLDRPDRISAEYAHLKQI